MKTQKLNINKYIRFAKIDEFKLKPRSISREMSGEMQKTENSRETVRLNRVFPGKSCEQISVKTDMFITDLNDFATINEVYKQFFDEHQATYPTRSCVQVARLPKDVKLEIEAIAVRSA